MEKSYDEWNHRPELICAQAHTHYYNNSLSLMKHITCYRLLALVLATLFFLPATTQELPIDSDLRYGTLPGGMTYYIRHNAEPQGKAEFWMAYHVGSVQEEESERGLAHFLEHMAFNGTVHFDAGEMIHYLTANGISFGKDINASTSFEQTIYHISQVPTGRPALLDPRRADDS